MLNIFYFILNDIKNIWNSKKQKKPISLHSDNLEVKVSRLHQYLPWKGIIRNLSRKKNNILHFLNWPFIVSLKYGWEIWLLDTAVEELVARVEEATELGFSVMDALLAEDIELEVALVEASVEVEGAYIKYQCHCCNF